MFRPLLPRVARLQRGLATPANLPASEKSGVTRHNWKRKEIQDIYNSPLLELVFRAATVHREHQDPNKIQLCTLMNIKSSCFHSRIIAVSLISVYLWFQLVDALRIVSSCFLEEICILNYPQAHTAPSPLVTPPRPRPPVCSKSTQLYKQHGKLRRTAVRDSAWVRHGGIFQDGNEVLTESSRWSGRSAGWEWKSVRLSECSPQSRLNSLRKRTWRSTFGQRYMLNGFHSGLTAYNHNLDTSREFYPKVGSMIALHKSIYLSVCARLSPPAHTTIDLGRSKRFVRQGSASALVGSLALVRPTSIGWV